MTGMQALGNTFASSDVKLLAFGVLPMRRPQCGMQKATLSCRFHDIKLAHAGWVLLQRVRLHFEGFSIVP